MLKSTFSENISKINAENLSANGFNYFQDVISAASTIPWVREIYEGIQNRKQSFVIKSALDLWHEELGREAVCALPGVGEALPPGCILEVCGGPGQGKTQFCLQLCLHALMRPEVEVVFVDTAANFSPDRMEQLVLAGDMECDILRRIHVLQVLGSSQFCAAIHMLEDFVTSHPRLRLIIIDSITFPFKDGCPEMERTGILYRTMASLKSLALQSNLAVVVSNEVSARVGLGVTGALGDSWAHLPSRRLLLAPPLIALTHSDPRLPMTAVQITERGLHEVAPQ